MALVEITSVTRCKSELYELAGSSIDLPVSESRSEIYEMDIIGWALAHSGPPEVIELTDRDRVIRRGPPNVPREGVAEIFPHIPNARQCGFQMACSVIGLSPEFEIEVTAFFRGNKGARLATIRGRHQPLRASNFEPALQPLMLTSLGRTGTTWLMRLLSRHPAVIAHQAYPNEVKCGAYWLHMLKVLSEPANLAQSAHPDSFEASSFWVGNHPFHSYAVTHNHPPLRDWFGRSYVENLAGFCQRSIENFYLQLANIQEPLKPAYFAEKYLPSHLPRIVWELYPRAREIFLVRDFRDVLCSIFAFNERRGFSAFGRDQVENDERFVRRLLFDTQRLLASWRERSDRAHLVRYEDIILQPERTLETLFRYLDLDHSHATISTVMDEASKDVADLEQHRTTTDPKDSIGRWRRDLDPQLCRQSEEAFSDILTELGYAN